MPPLLPASSTPQDQGIDLSQDKLAVQRLREAAEKAKCELSSTTTTDINLPFITADAAGPKHLHVTITRAKLESLVGDLLERTKPPCHQVGALGGGVSGVALGSGPSEGTHSLLALGLLE